MRIVFMGTPEISLPSLNKLVQNHDVVCVVTQPDRPKGRGMNVVAPPIKFMAEQLNIPVMQPLKISEIENKLKALRPDLIVVVAFGHILTKEILKTPKFGCLNLHASLLPEFRGPEPISWSIIKGKTKTGVTTMWMDEGIDTGDIILQKEIDVLPEDTKGSLEQKIALTGTDLLCETIKRVEAGDAPRKKQAGTPTFAPMIKKEDCLIDWSKSATEIQNLVRGLNLTPSAYTFFEGKRLKIHKASVVAELALQPVNPGEIVESKNDSLVVATGKDLLSIIEIQSEGKRAMSIKEYLSGHSIKKEMRFQ